MMNLPLGQKMTLEASTVNECVKQRKKNGKYVGEKIDEPLDVDIKNFKK